MDGLIAEHGARFLVGVPHPTATAQAFAQQAAQSPAVRRALAGRRVRLLYATTHDELDKEGDRDHCREGEAVYYDYSRNQMVRVRGGIDHGAGHLVEISDGQPVPSPEEFAQAVELIRQSSVWGPMLQAQHVHPYTPMPPMLIPEVGEKVERTLYVGLVSRERLFNRIVAVNMINGDVSREPVSPRGAITAPQVCGAEAMPCFRPRRGTPGTVTIQWPAENPVWQFQAIRPSSSSGTNASAIELRNVKYRGKLVLKQAHVPMLNVKYNDDLCGPYRDWLYEETCFQATGTDIPGANGFRWCSEPPQTIFESGEDSGNFIGVAVYEHEDGSLRLVSQLSAGWYRYIPEWRFYPDGRLMPRFRFGGTDSHCVCNVHHHHPFWRLDFDIFNKKNRVEELVDGVWMPMKREAARRRTPGVEMRWRVLHQKQLIGYEIISGPDDGVGDEFSGDDQFLLRYRKKELDDGRGALDDMITGAKTEIEKFVKHESTHKADSVVWYAAHFNHDVGDNDEHLTELGPTLVPINWPGA